MRYIKQCIETRNRSQPMIGNFDEKNLNGKFVILAILKKLFVETRTL